MSYFVVERSGDGGVLRIPLPTGYETREAAIAALSAAAGSGEVTLAGEVFIADLGSAVPVLLMAAVAPAPAAEVTAGEQAREVPDVESEPKVDEVAEVEVSAPVEIEAAETGPGDFILEEADAVPAVLDQAAADEVYTSWAPIPDVTTRGAALADAIKRATTTLEDEGVVAPESVLTEAGADESTVEEPSDAGGALGEAPMEQAADAEPASEWPWANIESYEVPADGAQPVDEMVVADASTASVVAEPAGAVPLDQDVAAMVESLGEDAPIITSAPPEGEEAYLPHPLILGDYAEAPSGPEEAAVDAFEVPLEGGYAPTGDLDLGEYTCEDCVYSNTCPKVGQVTPADCGSFQWKSE